jgi:hypothetical protein
MSGTFLAAFFVTLARALLARACAEALWRAFKYLAPDMPPILLIAIALVLGVVLVEIAAILWHRRNGSHDPP